MRECLYDVFFRKGNIAKKMNKIIPIVLIFNEKYLPLSSVTIQSIIDHATSDRFYKIHLISKCHTHKTNLKFKSMQTENVKIEMLNIDGNELDNAFIDRHLTSEAYYRLLVSNLFPQYEKIIYLDVDTLVLDDISCFFSIDIKNNLIAGVKEILPDCLLDYEAIENRLEPEAFLQSGVLLFNARLWRKEKLLNFAKKLLLTSAFRLHDEDVLNIICKGRIEFVHSCWNRLIHTISDKSHNCMLEMINLRHDLITQKNVSILHYSGGRKPWNDKILLFSNLWWNCARRTPFYIDLLEYYTRERKEF